MSAIIVTRGFPKLVTWKDTWKKRAMTKYININKLRNVIGTRPITSSTVAPTTFFKLLLLFQIEVSVKDILATINGQWIIGLLCTT